jgi:TolB-like protein
VLPFDNMSDDASQEYFVDGMTEDLITDLPKISGLFVIARNSSFVYKGQAVQVRRVAEELGVRYVLEGSVRRAGEQVRINAQLIDATTGGHLWAERYDGTLDDVFALQDDVTREIIAALSVTLTGEEAAQQARRETANAAAHDAYLRGWAHYKLLTPEALTMALPFFEEAIRLDPGLASFQAEERDNGHLESALKWPTPLAHSLQARIMASYGLHELAVAEAEHAVALDRNDATTQAGIAEALIFADRPGEALGPIQTAMRLDPHHPPD